MPLASKPLQRQQSLQQQAYQALRTAILSGELTSGQRLVETQLAQKLEVSRTPVREAIRQLEQENLVEVDQQGILRVATMSPMDAAHLYDCRIALEQLSVATACQKATASQLEQLQSIVNKAEELNKQSTQDVEWEKLDVDYQFHRYLAQISGNNWLVSLLEQVFDKMLLLRVQTLKRNPRVLEIGMEHRRIYEAIASGDQQKAMMAIAEHLSAAKQRVIEEVNQIQKGFNHS